MNGIQREVYAAYGGLSAGDLAQIMGDRNLDPFTQSKLLASALAVPSIKETGRAHYHLLVQERAGYSQQIAAGLDWLSRLGLEQSPLDQLSALPHCSFAIGFRFTLAWPYLSQDDDAFYIIDNSVRKDKVFKTPFVSPSSWKGSLRHTLWQLGHQNDNSLNRLFGKVNEVNDEGQAGRLFFYPTFFNRISLEIINPHDRKRRVGKNPILFESVPEGTTGQFTLLYVPFDRIGDKEANPPQKQNSLTEEIAEDLNLLAEGLRDMFTAYGFGAKTSSGFGLADERMHDGYIQTNILETVQQAEPPHEPVMPEALQMLLQQFSDEDFSLKPNEWRKRHGATTVQRTQYRNARSEYQTYQEAQDIYQKERAQWEAEAIEPAQTFIGEPFSTLADIPNVAEHVARKLRVGGEI